MHSPSQRLALSIACAWAVWAALAPHALGLSESACRPCRFADGPQCTHPGNANRMWCAARCVGGVNSAAACPATHCFCEGGSGPTPRACVPCQANDTQNVHCTHPGVASQAWCDARCPKGVNTGTCPATHCTCGGTAQQPQQTAPVDSATARARVQASTDKAGTLAAEARKDFPSTTKTSQPSRDVFLPYAMMAAAGFVMSIFVAFFAARLKRANTAVQHAGYAGDATEKPHDTPRERNLTRMSILV